MADGELNPSDEELVSRVLAGDRDAFGTIVGRYQSRVVNFLYRMSRDLDAAHDLAQDVFIRVHNALDRFDPAYRFSTWLFRVAQNLAIDDIRRRRIQTVSLHRGETDSENDSYEWELPSDAPGPYRDARNVERADAIQQAISALPWEYRELILLRHYAELSYEEIASSKQMPLGTVKNKLFRARQMLKDKLADFLED